MANGIAETAPAANSAAQAGQLVNVIWTLLLAYLLFGGVLFPLSNIS